MTLADKNERKPQRKGKKKTWEAPRVKSGQLFESNSLACGKSTPTTQQCIDSGATS